MIRQGVAVITVNANSATALNGVINEAKRAQHPGRLLRPGGHEPLRAQRHGRSLRTGASATRNGSPTRSSGKGKVVVLDGIPGHPAAEARKQGRARHLQAVSRHRDRLVRLRHVGPRQGAERDGDRDRGAARRSTAPSSRTPWAWACCAPSRTRAGTIPVMTGEAQKAFLLAWKKELDGGTDMQAFAQPNPPDISRNAIGIAVRLAAGRKLKPVARQHDLLPDPPGGHARQSRRRRSPR